MSRLPIIARAAGKLYVAGEYGVVQPHHRGVLIAVDRWLRVRLEPAQDLDEMNRADQLGAERDIDSGQLLTARQLSQAAATGILRRDYALTAFVVMDRLRKERGREQIPFQIRVDNHLRSEGGQKFGLGSSAAIVAAVVVAMNELYELELSDEEIFRVGLLASIEISANSSGGDLAASVFGGWVLYQSPDRTILPKVITDNGSITDALAHEEWDHTLIQRLQAPELKVLIGWTGTPASTDSQVSLVTGDETPDAGNGNAESAYSRFLAENQAAVDELVGALTSSDLPAVLEAIRSVRATLDELAASSGVEIETPLLATLRELAETPNPDRIAAKLSGAGGGDCGIAVAKQDVDSAEIFRIWRQAGIQPLEFGVTPRGAHIEDHPENPSNNQNELHE